MATVGEIVQGVLDVVVGNYPTYFHKPAVLIVGKDNLDRFPPGQGVLIREANENPEYTVNRGKILTREYCILRVLEHSSAEREDLYLDVETLILASSHCLIPSKLRRENKMKLFIIVFEVRLLN